MSALARAKLLASMDFKAKPEAQTVVVNGIEIGEKFMNYEIIGPCVKHNKTVKVKVRCNCGAERSINVNGLKRRTTNRCDSCRDPIPSITAIRK